MRREWKAEPEGAARYRQREFAVIEEVEKRLPRIVSDHGTTN